MAAINHPLGHARRGLPIPTPRGNLNLGLGFAVTLAAVCSLLPVLQNSTATSRGFDIQAAQRREAEVRGEIGLLESEVASLTSITRIERRALEIGLLPVNDPIYVTVNEPGPAPAKLPSEFLPRTESRKGESSPWWKPLVSWLP
jgi:hypothetical protein